MDGSSRVPEGTIVGGEYRIERLLGEGGMGAVYEAVQLNTGHRRALKIMAPSLAPDSKSHERFEREARASASIRSDHVVQVLAAGIDSGSPWIAMELLEGEDLASVLARRGRLPHGEAALVLSQLCHALAAAHAEGIVHRDLKPENVFVVAGRRADAALTVKVLDFGIAKMIADANATATAPIGTPLYMAPEQTEIGAAIAPATDVWALGLVAFRVLTGKSYWRAPNAGTASPAHVLREVVVSPLPPASERARELGVDAHLPDGFDAWFARCVVRDIDARFPDAAAAWSALEPLLPPPTTIRVVDAAAATMPVSTRSAETREAPSVRAADVITATRVSARQTAPRKRWVALAAGVGLVAAAAAFALRLGRVPAPPPPAPVASATTAPSAAPPRRAPPEIVGDVPRFGVPLEGAPQRGPRDALVTIVEFAEFQCPASKATRGPLAEVLDKHPDDVRLVWRENPLSIHGRAEAAAMLAREAFSEHGAPGFWKAHDELFAAQPKLDRPDLLAVAKRLDLDVDKATKAIDDHVWADRIAADVEIADAVHVYDTPVLVVNGRIASPRPKSNDVEIIVEEELAIAQKLVASGVARADVYETITGGSPKIDAERRIAPRPSSVPPGWGAEMPSVYIIEFCTYKSWLCARLDPVLERLVAAHKDEVGVIWYDASDPSNDEALLAAEAAREASLERGVDDHFRAMQKLLFEKPDGLDRRAVEGYAKRAGLDVAAFKRALDDHHHTDAVLSEATRAKQGGFEPPSFLICPVGDCYRTGGYYLHGAPPVQMFERRIQRALEDARASRPQP